ncbi:Ferritin heavy chain B [Varanus komodoensis]|nr:Ferritin heavy chain B [Varanus komodoensis]
MASQVHQNFHAECEAAVNHLVSLELHASFVYLSMLEKKVNQALLELHKLAMEKEDPQRCDFLESEFLEEQAKAIEQLGDHIANLKCLEVPQNGLGEYLFEWLTWGNSS